MTHNKKKVIAIVIIVILAVVVVVQANNVNHDLRQMRKPTMQSRKLSKLGIYKIMTVNEICKRYKIQKIQVFEFLEITPSEGDENLSLMKLQKKYNKTPEEMKKNLRKLLEYTNSEGKKI